MLSLNVSPRGVSALIGLAAFCASPSQAQNLTSLGDYSVVVSGNFSTSSDVEGRTIVGGNLTGTNSANFAIKLQGQVATNDLTLRVGGDIVSGNPIQLNAGSLELGGSLNGRHVNYNGGGSLVPNSGADYTAIIDELTLASDLLSALGPNSNVLIPAPQPGPYKFDATPDASGLAIFSIDGTALFGNQNVQQIELLANGATDVLINVSGSTINWQHGNLVGLFTESAWRESIVWNFHEAESINFGSKNMMGQILAPNADVIAQGNLDGSIFAKNLTTTSEVHLPGYNGNMAVPEPSALLLGACGALLLLRRRRN